MDVVGRITNLGNFVIVCLLCLWKFARTWKNVSVSAAVVDTIMVQIPINYIRFVFYNRILIIFGLPMDFPRETNNCIRPKYPFYLG